MACRGIAKGNVVQLEEGTSLPEGTEVIVQVQETKRGSPEAILAVMRGLPEIDPIKIDELERFIEAGKLPVRLENVFEQQRA